MDANALHKLGYGLYVVGSHDGDKLNGQIANTVFQITSDPPTLAVSINRRNLTHEYITTSKAFSVAVLTQDTPLPYIGGFGFKSGRDTDKTGGKNYKIGQTGCPVFLDNANAYIEAELITHVDIETHTVFIGKVVDAAVLTDAVGMTYEHYFAVKRGTTPRTAPSYIAKQ